MRNLGPVAKAHTRDRMVRIAECAAAGLAICLLTLSSPAVHAQTLSGIQGTVTDQAGLPIPNAEITIANTDTGVRRNTTTGSVGSYHLTDLNPGTYTVTVEKPGFKSSVQKNVFVRAAANSTANIVMNVGNARETVEVNAPEISLETEQASLGTTIQHKLLEELPQLVEGTVRQIDTPFMCLPPGVTTVTMTDGASARGVSSVGRISGGLTPGVSTDGRINGGVDFQNEVVFNGVPIAFAEFQGRQYLHQSSIRYGQGVHCSAKRLLRAIWPWARCRPVSVSVRHQQDPRKHFCGLSRRLLRRRGRGQRCEPKRSRNYRQAEYGSRSRLGLHRGRSPAYSQTLRWARQDILVREPRKVSPDLCTTCGNSSN